MARHDGICLEYQHLEAEIGGLLPVWGQGGLHSEFKANLNYLILSQKVKKHTEIKQSPFQKTQM